MSAARFRINVATDGVGAAAFDEYHVGQTYDLWQAIGDPSLLPRIAREFADIARIEIVRTDLDSGADAVSVVRHGPREFEWYLLPDGRTVPVDATASKGAAVIDFTLEGGAIVDARRVDPLDLGERANLRAALEGVLRTLPNLWGEHVRDGYVRLPIEESAIDAALKALGRQ